MSEFNLEILRKDGFQVLDFPLNLKIVILTSVKNNLYKIVQGNGLYKKTAINQKKKTNE